MQKYLFIMALLLASHAKLNAQKINTDSLWRKFEHSKDDSLKLDAFFRLYAVYASGGIDSNFYYSKRLTQICNQQNLPRYNALGILYSSYIFNRIGDYKKLQEQISKAMMIAEKINDEEVLARVENFSTFIEEDPYKKVEHLRKAILYKKALTKPDPIAITFLGNMSIALLSINQPDSAFFYAQKMYEHSIRIKDSSSYINGVMGNAYLNMGQPDIAYAFFRKGVKMTKQNSFGSVGRAYLPMAGYFEKMNQPDSALYYWKKTFEFDPSEKTKLSTAKKIYQYYLKKGATDSAAKYMDVYISKNDSLNSTTKVAKLQAAKFEDELRQQEFAKNRQEEEQNRQHNIQLVITAIGILSAVIFFLLLSRSFIIHHRVVAFLSVVILLIVFEFINLLIHPFLEKITHHSPVIMLLGLVAIAALIVPLHHKLEHWATNKLVEKNKAIRLAKAK
jgi:tetratricopeptide (TPR) repeat protein